MSKKQFIVLLIEYNGSYCFKYIYIYYKISKIRLNGLHIISENGLINWLETISNIYILSLEQLNKETWIRAIQRKIDLITFITWVVDMLGKMSKKIIWNNHRKESPCHDATAAFVKPLFLNQHTEKSYWIKPKSD